MCEVPGITLLTAWMMPYDYATDLLAAQVIQAEERAAIQSGKPKARPVYLPDGRRVPPGIASFYYGLGK